MQSYEFLGNPLNRFIFQSLPIKPHGNLSTEKASCEEDENGCPYRPKTANCELFCLCLSFPFSFFHIQSTHVFVMSLSPPPPTLHKKITKLMPLPHTTVLIVCVGAANCARVGGKAARKPCGGLSDCDD